MSNTNGTCKFYVSVQKPECGDKSEGTVVTRLSDGGKATVELCAKHLKDHRQAQAEAARRRLDAKVEREGVPYLTKNGVVNL